MSRTTGTIASSLASGAWMTMSIPSPSTLSSESVTSAAISTSASDEMSRPVISQSIQTMRSFLDSWWGVGEDVGAGVSAEVGSGITRLYRRRIAAPARDDQPSC